MNVQVPKQTNATPKLHVITLKDPTRVVALMDTKGMGKTAQVRHFCYFDYFGN